MKEFILVIVLMSVSSKIHRFYDLRNQECILKSGVLGMMIEYSDSQIEDPVYKYQ